MSRPEFWTVQFFPDNGGVAHSLRVRTRTAYVLIAVFSAFIALSAAWMLGFLGERHSSSELARYKAENDQLISSLAAMEERSERLTLALDDLAARDHRFRVLAGLPVLDPEVYAVGIGGTLETDPAHDRFFEMSPELAGAAQTMTMDLDQLLRRADLLSTSLAEATDSMATQRELFRSQPSIFPVLDEEAWISSGFSYNRLHPLLGYRRPHPGVDISADFGSPVIASGAGRVIFAGKDSGYGMMVEIDHGFGFVTRYAHLSRIVVRQGAAVDRGDPVGEVGRTGLATGPNLHYEVHVDGRPMNPRSYLLDQSLRR